MNQILNTFLIKIYNQREKKDKIKLLYYFSPLSNIYNLKTIFYIKMYMPYLPLVSQHHPLKIYP